MTSSKIKPLTTPEILDQLEEEDMDSYNVVMFEPDIPEDSDNELPPTKKIKTLTTLEILEQLESNKEEDDNAEKNVDRYDVIILSSPVISCHLMCLTMCCIPLTL